MNYIAVMTERPLVSYFSSSRAWAPFILFLSKLEINEITLPLVNWDVAPAFPALGRLMVLGGWTSHTNMAEATALTSTGHIPTPAYGGVRPCKHISCLSWDRMQGCETLYAKYSKHMTFVNFSKGNLTFWGGCWCIITRLYKDCPFGAPYFLHVNKG